MSVVMKENIDVIKSDLIEQPNEKPGDQADEDETQAKGDDPGPHNQEIDNNKVDEGSSKCEQQIMENMIGTSTIRENKGPKVEILSMSVLCPGRKDIEIALPFPSTTSKATLFTFKEGTKYQTLYHFKVSKSVVTGLTYIEIVSKAGVKVKQVKKMMGTFSPREEPYTFEVTEGTIPKGLFARGSTMVRVKFEDDEGKCYLDATYHLDVRKDWGATDKC